MDCEKCDEHKLVMNRIDSLDKAIDKLDTKTNASVLSQNQKIDDLYNLIYKMISEQKIQLSLICGGFSLLGSILPLIFK